MVDLPEIPLTDPEVLRDPFTAYGQAREAGPVARLATPGFGEMWAVTRHAPARALLTDPRFAVRTESYLRPGVPEEYRPYLRTMEIDGPEHGRLRRLVAPAFTARRAAALRPRIASIVAGLLDEVIRRAEGGVSDLVPHLARPLPMEVICELVGVPDADRAPWRAFGVAVSSGDGQGFVAALPAIIDNARSLVAHRRDEPGDDLVTDLIRVRDTDGDRLTETELVSLVWHVVLAGQTPTNLVTNSVHALLTHPGQLAALRADPELMPRAVEELTRWAPPQLLTVPRFAAEEVEIDGVPVPAGTAVTVAIVAANRDPRVFADPDRLDLARVLDRTAHLAYAHGPHFCLGAALARVQTEVALDALLGRFPDLALAPADAQRAPDPGTWRLNTLPVTL
ncbi:cytochrome P450 [Micromonospora yangpuensis]|uniref:Cytochrome P450 n=1 Tax=Micromonospora yangpuensis TaxID=683228 RepID=A0A1C6V2Y1_9ACTN|nr:cytochrome P450 [Micromonospora yangpuensis]GGL98492.1 cytochrome P450 [Micromonospora yangpuensis]SCL60477.1 Cytochrome P450 [Micromonospora yangpuensis]